MIRGRNWQGNWASISLLLFFAVICRSGPYRRRRDTHAILSSRIYHSLYLLSTHPSGETRNKKINKGIPETTTYYKKKQPLKDQRPAYRAVSWQDTAVGQRGDELMRGKLSALFMATLALLVLSSGFFGCATKFSPAVIRDEIARQTGEDPKGVFELSLGRPTVALAKAVLASASPEGSLPLAGVTALELAVYEVPGTGADLDFTRMPLRGWEPVIKFREGPRSTLVLLRSPGAVISDLVVVAGGSKQVVYGRLRGRLSPTLPHELERTVRSGGPEALQRGLMSLSELPP